MSKVINAIELAEIVTGLLLRPTVFNIDDPKKHSDFMVSVAGLVTEYFGGSVASPPPPVEKSYVPPYDYPSTYLEIEENGDGVNGDSVDANVWLKYGIEGPVDAESQVLIDRSRAEIQVLLAQHALSKNKPQQLSFSIIRRESGPSGNDGNPTKFGGLVCIDPAGLSASIFDHRAGKLYDFMIDIQHDGPVVHIGSHGAALADVCLFEDRLVFSTDIKR